MFDLRAYGVPEVLAHPELKIFTPDDLYYAKNIKASCDDYHKLDSFNDPKALSRALCALLHQQDLRSFTILYHELPNEVMKDLDFDWFIDESSSISYPNYYFLKYYDELYFYSLVFSQSFLSQKGQALKRLSQFSFQPWNSYQLPMTEKIRQDFSQFYSSP